MRYFTSDLHFDDDRLSLFGRDLAFKTKEEVDDTIIRNWNSVVTDEDVVFVLGDVALTMKGLEKIARCKGSKILIKGNYDETSTAKFAVNDDILRNFFDVVTTDGYTNIGDTECYMNHYPTKGKNEAFNLTGHIHGLWKVQRNSMNVGADANHFTPVSEQQVAFTINGIKNHYDQNVFAGEIECNMVHKPSLKLETTEINDRPNVIVPGTDDMNNSQLVFLAGPIQDTEDWQIRAIDWLNEHREDDNFIIASPRRNYEKGEFDYDVQVNWESRHLSQAAKNGVIVFWLAKQTNFNPTRSYAQTTRFELAEWYTVARMDYATLVVGIEPGFTGERYIRERLYGITIHTTLEDTLSEALTLLRT